MRKVLQNLRSCGVFFKDSLQINLVFLLTAVNNCLFQITDPVSQILSLTSIWIKEEWSTFINGINLFEQIGKKKLGYFCQTDLCFGLQHLKEIRISQQLT